MLDLVRRRRDYFAGGLMMLIGLGAAVAGGHDRVGTLQKMGPGFFPLALGILLTILGIAIAGTASSEPAEGDAVIPERPEWRGWLCIVGGATLFIVLGHFGGLAPATFACVFVAAMGDRTTTVKASLLLAAAMTVLGIVLFAKLLGVPLPIWQWSWS